MTQTFGFDWKAIKEARDAYVYRLNGIYDRLLKNSGVEVIHGVRVTRCPWPEERRGQSRQPQPLLFAHLSTNPQTQVARFTGPRRVRVGDKEYTADHVLVATGGKPIMPHIPGIEVSGGLWVWMASATTPE